MKKREDATNFVQLAAEVAIYLDPDCPELPLEQFVEYGFKSNLHLGRGSTTDALDDLVRRGMLCRREDRFSCTADWADGRQLADFNFVWTPDPRPREAVQALYDIFDELRDKVGQRKAHLSRPELLHQLASANHSQFDARLAIRILRLARYLVEEEVGRQKLLRLSPAADYYARPQAQLAAIPIPRSDLAHVLELLAPFGEERRQRASLLEEAVWLEVEQLAPTSPDSPIHKWSMDPSVLLMTLEAKDLKRDDIFASLLEPRSPRPWLVREVPVSSENPDSSRVSFEANSLVAKEAISEARWPSDRPIRIQNIAIRNVRCLHDVVFTVPTADTKTGQWIVITGDNGVGKTTILQTIAMAFSPPRFASSILTTRFDGSPYLTLGSHRGHTKVELVQGGGFHFKLHKSDSGELLSPADRPQAYPLVFGYGSQRGSALGGPARDVRFDRVSDTATLFDENAWLIHAETWIRSIKLLSHDSPQEGLEFYNAVINTLISLLPGVAEINVDSDQVTVTGLVGDNVPLAGLSDGYLTTLGWVVDLVARWSHGVRSNKGLLSSEFASDMRCLVLIDELDLHLHPRWQTEIVTTVRKAFPNTTFIVTTHSPLTLHGTGQGEVYTLSRDAHGRIVSARNDVPLGMRADQILTGRWFELASTLDADTLEMLERQRQMIREGVHSEDPELRILEQALRQRLGRFADTAIERAALEIVARYLDEQRPITAGDLEAMHEMLRDKLGPPTS